VPEQPAPACRWLDIWRKTKSSIWLYHVTSVVIVKQQDGDKKIIAQCILKTKLTIFFSFAKTL
jgi:hypothetical protein